MERKYTYWYEMRSSSRRSIVLPTQYILTDAHDVRLLAEEIAASRASSAYDRICVRVFSSATGPLVKEVWLWAQRIVKWVAETDDEEGK